LLEVVLALAILAMSTAILAQVSWTATENGLMAHRLATAQILAESKMAEVVTGAIPIQSSIDWTQITDLVPKGTWYYRVEPITAVRPDMVGVRLAITDENGLERNAELFYVVRWMIDPSLGLDLPPSQTTTGATGTGATGGTTSGGASGSAAMGGVQ
jgi:hypothetical protein